MLSYYSVSGKKAFRIIVIWICVSYMMTCSIVPNKVFSVLFVITTVRLSPLYHADQDCDSISQSQSSIIRAIDALPKRTEFMTELDKLRLYMHSDQEQEGGGDQDFIRELSVLDFKAKQKIAYGKRYPNTCQWLLDSPAFQAWLKSSGTQHSVLWCQGNPGVGKTVMTSIAINYVTESIGGRKIALTYIYCDYTNPDTFLVLNLLGSIIQQLVEQTSNFESTTKLKTFKRASAKNRDMTEEDAVFWIETLSGDFDIIYTFVDALDECPESCRNTLLAQLKGYSKGNMRVFLTSRSNVDVEVHIAHAVEVNIDPIRNDITDYVESKIKKSSRLARLIVGNSKLKRDIVHTINSQANGMFLLASLQIESLNDQTTASGVRLALKKLPADLFAMYDKIMERIRDQSKQDAELGLKALLMMSGAQQMLTVDELRHALAVEPGVAHLDAEALPHLEILLNATAGLVTAEDYNETPEGLQKVLFFVHRTLDEYFDINRERLFPELRVFMARKCLSYLSLEEFESGMCVKDELFLKRKNDFCFFSYASNHWAFHVRSVQTELMDLSLAFVQNTMKTSAWLQSIKNSDSGSLIRYSDEDLPLDPTCLAAQLHLSELCAKLISLRGSNSRNSLGETLLHQAVGGEPLYLYSTRSIKPRNADQYATALVLFEHGVDIDAKDSRGKTVAFDAVSQNNGNILSLLLDHGANVNHRMDDGTTLLRYAIRREGAQEILQILLDKSPDVNALTNKGRSVIHSAVLSTTSTIIDRLIDLGADFNVADSRGITPVLEAARQPRLEMLKTLIKRGASPNVTDSVGRTPLHFAFLWFHRFDVLETLSRIQEIDALDKKGRTPLHHVYYALAQSQRKLLPNRYAQFHEDQMLHTPKYAAIIERLIKLGASETITDAEGRKPEDYSQWSTHGDAVRWVNGYSNLTHIVVSESDELLLFFNFPALLFYDQPRINPSLYSVYNERNRCLEDEV